MHPSRDQNQPPGWSDQLKRAFRLRDPWSRSKKVLLGSILSSLLAIIASLADFGSLFQMWKSWGSPDEVSSEELHEEQDRSSHKSPQTSEETPEVTLDSLNLKHKDSRTCLEIVLSLRDSKEPKDLKIARSCLSRVIQNERPTASEELLSHLYALQDDLLVRDREPGRVHPSPDIAFKLSPDNAETSERPYERRLYQDDPVYKGPKDPPTTIDSLDLKHRDSRPCLDLVLRLRGSKESRDREIARSCLERAIQNESPTASDELLSQLYTLRGDLLIREGESAKSILDLETASRLSPGSVETAILLLRAYKTEGHKLRTPPPWPEDLQRRIHELDKKIDALEEKLQGSELRGRSVGAFIGIEKFSGFNLADIPIAANSVTLDRAYQLGLPPLETPCLVSSISAFASGTCGLGGNGQVATSRTAALDTGYHRHRETVGIESNSVFRLAHLATHGRGRSDSLGANCGAPCFDWRAATLGAIATAVRDLELSINSFRAEESQVIGSVKIDTRLNGALLTTAGRDAKVHFGDIDLRNSRINGVLDVATRVNGAVTATAGRDLELSIGSFRAEESQAAGSVKMGDIDLNGAVLITAGRDAEVHFGDIDLRNSRVNGYLDVATIVNGPITVTAGRDLDLSAGVAGIQKSQAGAVTSVTPIDGPPDCNAVINEAAGTAFEPGSTDKYIFSLDRLATSLITTSNTPRSATPYTASNYFSYPIRHPVSFENLNHDTEFRVDTAEYQPSAVGHVESPCTFTNETTGTTVEPGSPGSYYSFDHWNGGSITASNVYTGGFTPQARNVAGNEANFVVQGVTGGSRMPSGIRFCAPTCSNYISADRDFGMASPSLQLQDHNPVEEVLAVGVNGAGTASLDRLQHAAEDAQRVSAALHDLDFRSTVLVDEAATHPKILEELWRVVQESRPADVFIFYFSGHGFTDVNGHPVLVTGGNLDGVMETLSLEELDYVLSFHRGQAIILLDTCLNETQFDSGAYQRSVAGPNRPIFIVAGAPGSRVIESPRLGSGLFTFTLLRFLEQQRSHPELNFDELYRYTATETSRLARDLYGEDQRPQQLLLR